MPPADGFVQFPFRLIADALQDTEVALQRFLLMFTVAP
jgi:hypothetical protein